MDLKKLDSMLRRLSIDSITAGETINVDTPIEKIKEAHNKLEKRIEEIKSWVSAEIK